MTSRFDWRKRIPIRAREIIVTCLVCLMLIPTFTLYAQDTILYVEVTVDPPDTKVNWEFIEEFKNSLQQQNIQLVIVDDPSNYPYFWEQNALRLTFGTLPPDQTQQMIFITPYVTMELSPSPILEATMLPVAAVIDPEHSEPLSKAITLSMGMALYATENCDMARQKLGTALFDSFIHPDVTKAIIFYNANCATVENDLEIAVQLLKSIIPKTPDRQIRYSEAMINLVWTYLQTEHRQEATDLLDDLVKITLNNNDGAIHHRVRMLSKSSQLYNLLADYQAAINSINAAIEISLQSADSYNLTTFAELFVLRGQMYLNLYEWDQSLEDYNLAIELDPDYAEAYFQRGVLYYSILQTGQELREEALADFRHYLDLAPDGPYAEQAERYAETIEAELAALNE